MREVARAVRGRLDDDVQARGVELEHVELPRAGEEAPEHAVELLGAAQVQERLPARAASQARPLGLLTLLGGEDVEQDLAQSRFSSLVMTLRQARPDVVRDELVDFTLRTIVRE